MKQFNSLTGIEAIDRSVNLLRDRQQFHLSPAFSDNLHPDRQPSLSLPN